MRSLHSFLPRWSRTWWRIGPFASGGLRSVLENSPAWRRLYLAAVLENDKGQVKQRIVEAKKAMVVRARELFLSPEDNLREESAIDDALLTLAVLEGSTKRSHYRQGNAL